MIDKKIYLKFWQNLKRHDNYLITTHINPDSDGICSVILLAMILKSLKKKYYIILEDSFPERFKFLIKDYADFVIPELIVVSKKGDLAKLLPETFKPQSVIIADTPGRDRLGRFSRSFLNLKTYLNIDHHVGKREFPGSSDLVDQEVSATGEIVYHLMKYNNYKITKDTASLIYLAIISDTFNFTQSNTSSMTHCIVSELLKTGIKVEDIYLHFIEHPQKVIQIYGKVIGRLKLFHNGKGAWAYITRKEMDECEDSNTDGLIELIRSVRNTQAAVLFKEVEKNKTKVCLRGKKGFNVYKMAREFDGGGHIQAAGFNYNMKLHNAIKDVLKKINKYF